MILLLQIPIVTDSISKSDHLGLPQYHTLSFIDCIITSACMGNIQNIQTIIQACRALISVLGSFVFLYTLCHLGCLDNIQNTQTIIRLCTGSITFLDTYQPLSIFVSHRLVLVLNPILRGLNCENNLLKVMAWESFQGVKFDL